jgi:hypothetical protein
MKENITLKEQVDILAKFLMDEFGGPQENEGAIEMAIRLLKAHKPVPVGMEIK